jgi:predicted nucleic acid-binding Zn ribbon protein
LRSDGPSKRKAVPGADRSKDGEGLGAVLDGLLGGRPWRAGMTLAALGRSWPDVVGERLAEESRPAAVDRGVLTVKASSAAWAAQIRFLGEEIARRSNEVLGPGAVASVRVLVDARPMGERSRRPRDVGGDQ